MPWMILGLLVTLALVAAARHLARRKGRDPFAWGLAAALFPPALILLLVLPRATRRPAHIML